MAQHSSSPRRARRRRPGGPRRWTSADKAAYLARFATSGQTIRTFCDASGVPRATFNLWQREAREASRAQVARATAPTFARVELAPAAVAGGVTMHVRRADGLEAELRGLDPATVVTVMQGVLRGRAS